MIENLGGIRNNGSQANRIENRKGPQGVTNNREARKTREVARQLQTEAGMKAMAKQGIKFSYITARLLVLAGEKGVSVGSEKMGRLLVVNSYLQHKIDASIEGGMRHEKVARDVDSRLLKNAFLQGTRKQLWKLINSDGDLKAQLAARKTADADRIARIITNVKENA